MLVPWSQVSLGCVNYHSVKSVVVHLGNLKNFNDVMYCTRVQAPSLENVWCIYWRNFLFFFYEDGAWGVCWWSRLYRGWPSQGLLLTNSSVLSMTDHCWRSNWVFVLFFTVMVGLVNTDSYSCLSILLMSLSLSVFLFKIMVVDMALVKNSPNRGHLGWNKDWTVEG